MSLYHELKRRNVFRVTIAYIVMAWLVMQVADVVLNNLELPGWVFQLILVSIVIGFPVTLLLAWVYELTPDGIKKESELSESAATVPKTAHRLNYVIIAVLILAVVYYAIFKDRVDVGEQDSLQTLVARPSVIVFPFANASGQEDQDYLAFGLTDELITGLQRSRNFPVISRSASLEFSQSELGASEYAASLGASYRVEGSISAADDGIRVLATLSGAGDNQVWAERFQHVADTTRLFEVADELVAKVSAAVMQSEIHRVQRTEYPPADAWEHFIKGINETGALDPGKYENARWHLEQAIEIDPDMAEVWAAMGLLEVENLISQPLLEESDPEQFYTIIDYFRRSHELNPFNGSACGCLGYMLSVVGKKGEARAVFEQAVEANPLSSGLRSDYAAFLLWDGHFEEAMENNDLVEKLGSTRFESASVWLNRSIVALAEGNNAEALEAVNRAMFINQNIYHTPTAVAVLYVAGDRAAAARLYNEMRQSYPDLSPRNPLLYTFFKPIDEILARQRELGVVDGPADTDEIYRVLSQN